MGCSFVLDIWVNFYVVAKIICKNSVFLQIIGYLYKTGRYCQQVYNYH